MSKDCKEVVFLDDNAKLHTTYKVVKMIVVSTSSSSVVVKLPFPSYLPSIAPRHYHLFLSVQYSLNGYD